MSPLHPSKASYDWEPRSPLGPLKNSQPIRSGCSNAATYHEWPSQFSVNVRVLKFLARSQSIPLDPKSKDGRGQSRLSTTVPLVIAIALAYCTARHPHDIVNEQMSKSLNIIYSRLPSTLGIKCNYPVMHYFPSLV